MDATIEARIRAQRSETLSRLAAQAERNGVQILIDVRRQQHVATSASDPGACYLLDAEAGCTCRGYALWARCQRHSLLLAQLGYIPETESECAAAMVDRGAVDPLPAQVIVLVASAAEAFAAD
jgi:hypothetical protein